MIQYRDWYIWTQGQVVARQFDHMTRSLEVTGELPEGWEWTAIVRVGDYMDYLPLTLTQTGAAITLTAQQLSLPGMYSIQLRGKQGELVRHTNVLSVYVPASLSGDAHWPELPSAFTAMERKVEQSVLQSRQAAQQAVQAAEEARAAVQGSYELVETLITPEDLASISRTMWPDGTPYNFKAVYVAMTVPTASMAGNINIYSRCGGENVGLLGIAALHTASPRIVNFYTHPLHGLWETQGGVCGGNYGTNDARYIKDIPNLVSDIPAIDRLYMTVVTAGTMIPAGTTIRIYGVRA